MTGTVLFVNSALSPLIYCWRLGDIRTAVIQRFPCESGLIGGLFNEVKSSGNSNCSSLEKFTLIILVLENTTRRHDVDDGNPGT